MDESGQTTQKKLMKGQGQGDQINNNYNILGDSSD